MDVCDYMNEEAKTRKWQSSVLESLTVRLSIDSPLTACIKKRTALIPAAGGLVEERGGIFIEQMEAGRLLKREKLRRNVRQRHPEGRELHPSKEKGN